MTGRRVIASLGLILLATAVLPPAAAWGVNGSRVRIASAEVGTLAEILRHVAPELRDAARRADVLCGPGRVPFSQTPAAERWVTATRAALAPVVGARRVLSADPWGNCYVVNLAAVDALGAVVWVLSAGPNGVIDTPFVDLPESQAGDDVRIRIR